jgi:hypothetical protein
MTGGSSKTGSTSRVVLAAAEQFPYGVCLPALRRLLKNLPDGTTLLIRGTTPEMAIAILAKRTRRFSFIQYPGGRREENYRRDVRLVADGESVILLFAPGGIGMGGTGHVMEKALDAGKPTVCYTCSTKDLVFIGSWE